MNYYMLIDAVIILKVAIFVAHKISDTPHSFNVVSQSFQIGADNEFVYLLWEINIWDLSTVLSYKV